jgi:hypothetical protein
MRLRVGRMNGVGATDGLYRGNVAPDAVNAEALASACSINSA